MNDYINKAICGDCLEVMKAIPDNSIDCVITDPPYFEIKGDFDFEYDNFNIYLSFMENVAIELKRICNDNCNILIFGHWRRIAYLQIIFDKYFGLINNLVWEKIDSQTKKGINNYRCFPPITERALLYTLDKNDLTGWDSVKLDVNNFKSLRKYFYEILCYIGKSSNLINEDFGNRQAEHCFYVMPKKEIINKIGGSSDHCLRYGSSQWGMPTETTYNKLIEIYNIDKYSGFKTYEELVKTYEEQRRYFNNKYMLYDVIKHIQESNISRAFNHDTIKPLGLIIKLIETLSRANDIIIDPFAGTGTTGIAALQTNRQYILIEKEQEYCDIINKQLSCVQRDLVGV